MTRRGLHTLPAATLTTLLAGSLLAGCSGDDDPAAADPSPTEQSSPSDATTTAPSPTASPSPAKNPADLLPKPVPAKRMGGRAITAEPFADFMIGTPDGVWVSGVGPGLVRYDADSGDITARTKAGAVVQALDHADGTVWAAQVNPGVLIGVDSATGRDVARVRLPDSPVEEASVASDGTTVWLLVDPAEPHLVAVDVASGRRTGDLPTPDDAVAVRFGFGSLWVPTDDDTVVRVDPRNGRVQDTIAVGFGPRFLTIGHGAVWVMNQVDGSVSRIDPRTGKARTIVAAAIPILGGDIHAGPTAVWVRTTDGATRIDPRTDKPTHLVDIDDGSGSITEVDGSVWLTDHDHDRIHRLPWPPPTV